jgi:predicted DNA-binding transcriptional regulator AlpA
MSNEKPCQAFLGPHEPLWDKRAAARYLGISAKTLDRWMAEGRGPRGRRVGVQIRYKPTDVQDFLQSCAPVGGGAA